MGLTPGTRLGPYEILSAIGAGGMGEVYKARDTRLDRTVAIKILPEPFAADADRVARFQREAKTLAALNHPNIAQIFGLEQAGDVHALAMELVAGEDLSERIARGSIPIEEVLPIAKQIADALEAAHEQGIIHRDLKPANIKVRDDGTVKVLDFGLAKALEGAGGAAQAVRENLSLSPTITTPAMTVAGMILGTAAYMSPEQAKGRSVDKRSDIWAFGAVLYEMLTGRRAFEAEDVSETFVAVLRAEVNLGLLPSSVPPHVLVALRRCLQKDPKQRFGDMQDVRLALERAFETARVEAPPAAAPAPPRPLWKRALPLLVTAVVVGAVIAGVMQTLRPVVPTEVTRFSIAFPEGVVFSGGTRQWVTVSPDGTSVVYAANRRLYLRRMSDLAEKPITTESPGGDRNPIFSPDSRSIAYWDGGDGTIRKIGLTGGATMTLCRTMGPGGGAGPLGMTWSDDSIFFTEAGGIMRVSEMGGTPELIVHADSGEQFAEPQILPDGEHLLFTIATGTELNRFDNARIVAESLKSHERKTLIDSGGAGRYLPTGHLLYAFGGVLFAVPFDLKRMAVTGGPVPVLEGVRRGTAAADVAVSFTGTLVYLPGSALATSALVTLGFFDRIGKAELLKVPPGAYQLPRLSPDGRHIAFETDDGRDATIWVYDPSGTSALRRLTFEGQGRNRFPVWSADSQRVTFQSDREKDLGIFWQRADGGGTAERLTKADEGTAHIPEAWSADGAMLLYNASGKDSMAGLWTFTLKDRRAERFDAVVSPLTTLTGAAFSPDGKWVAYASAEARSGAAVYVQPFPPTGAKYQISRNEDRGHHPLWSPDGKELFFTRAAGNSLDVVRISTQPTFSFGEAVNIPRPFSNDSPAAERPYDISRDGQRLLGLINPDQATLSGTPQVLRIQVVLNWFEELKAKVPTK